MQTNNKLFCNRSAFLREIDGFKLGSILTALTVSFSFLGLASRAYAGDAPPWMRALVNVPLPEHDEKTNAVLLLAEDTFTVQGSGRMKRIERRVYKILRPDGRTYGTIHAHFDSETKINFIHGWCIPAQGKDYEVKDKEAIETALYGVQDGELMSDLKTKVLTIPASEPGNIVGYEIEQEVHPYVIQDIWSFQREDVPVREAHYTLQLPAGWEYKAVWLNHAEVAPTTGSGSWQWTVQDVKGIRSEDDMPPWRGLAGSMVVSLLPPGAPQNKSLLTWNDVAAWYMDLTRDRQA